MPDDTTGIRQRLNLLIPGWIDGAVPEPVDLSRRDSVAIQRPHDGRRFVLGRQTYDLLVDLSRAPVGSFDSIVSARRLAADDATYQRLHEQVGRLCDVAPRMEAPGFLARWSLVPAPVAGGLGGALTGLFRWPFAVVALGLLLGVDIFIVLGLSLRQLTLTAAPVGLVVLLASAVVHEFGHAAALVRAGRRPGAIGFGIYLVWPVLYADTTEAWFLRRRERMLVDVGGVYFQLLFCLFVGLVGIGIGSQELQLAALLSQGATFVNFNPLFRYDGHWLLSDWLGVVNLYRSGRRSWDSTSARSFTRRDRLILRTFWAVAVIFWPVVLGGALVSFVVQLVVLVRRSSEPGFELFTTDLFAPAVTTLVLVIAAVNAARLLLARRQAAARTPIAGSSLPTPPPTSGPGSAR